MSEQSYEVTARKYRPQVFDAVIGQEHVTRTLQNALRSQQVSHAYLFAGPRGTGKTTTARLLAKALNCRSSETMTPDPCGECESCKAIARGNSVDVMEIDGASNRGIDQIRDLRETVGYASFEGRFKVYIIDEVHSLTKDAFNALLKTLEEPPRHVVFVFATTEPGKVLPTILSRVQRYDFRRIGVGPITETLARICEQENIKAEREALQLIARKADGALRDAESLLDQVRTFAGDEISLADAMQVLAVVDTERLFQLTALTTSGDAAGTLKFASGLADSGHDPHEFLLSYAEHLRHLIAAGVGGAEALETLPDTERERYVQKAAELPVADGLRRFELISRAAQDLRRSPQPWISLEVILLQLVHLDRAVDLRALLDRIDGALGAGGAAAGGASTGPAGPLEGGSSGQGRGGRSTGGGRSGGPSASGSGGTGGSSSGGTRAEQRGGTRSRPRSERRGEPAGYAGQRPTTVAREVVRETAEETPAAEAPETPVKAPAPVEPVSLPPADLYEDDMAEVPNPADAAGVEEPTLALVTGRWKELLEEVRRRKVSLGAFLAEARPLKVRGRELVLAFQGDNHTFHINMVERHADLLKEITREVLGIGLQIRCEQQPAGRGRERRESSVPTDDQEELNQRLLERLCDEDEGLAQIVQVFDAVLEDGPGGRPGA